MRNRGLEAEENALFDGGLGLLWSKRTLLAIKTASLRRAWPSACLSLGKSDISLQRLTFYNSQNIDINNAIFRNIISQYDNYCDPKRAFTILYINFPTGSYTEIFFVCYNKNFEYEITWYKL